MYNIEIKWDIIFITFWFESITICQDINNA